MQASKLEGERERRENEFLVTGCCLYYILFVVDRKQITKQNSVDQTSANRTYLQAISLTLNEITRRRTQN